MDPVFLVIFWLLMAIWSGAVARKKRGFWVGLAFVFVGLFVWPITLLGAYMMDPAAPKPLRADGFVAGKPYWSDGRGGVIARVDGRDVAFRSVAEMEAALGATAVELEKEEELIGQKLWRKIKEY